MNLLLYMSYWNYYLNKTPYNMSRDRFKDALWYNKPVRILVFGAGGIGSWTSFFLTRAGFNVSTLDFDFVEEHNLGGQMFLHASIGDLKVKALADTISLFNDLDYSFSYKNLKLDEYTNLETLLNVSYSSRNSPVIIISAFDNMQAREVLFNKFISYMGDDDFKKKHTYFIDGRLLMEQMRIYCIPGNRIDLHFDYIENHIFNDSEVEELACTMKQVSHGAAMIATHITGFVTNIVANDYEWKSEVFQVPYIWDYIIPFNKLTEQYAPS